MLRNERFNKFAKSLRPDDWESRIKVILPLIEKHAKQIWPNCSVGLHGSVLREVHNEYGSDIDIAIHTNSSCSEREFLDLCHWLTIEEDFVPLSDSSEVGKAAKFLSHGLKVDVAIQERFGDASLYDSKFIEQLRQLYKSHLQEAARVAKFAFPELKGLDVEFLVCCLAERRLKLGQTVVQSSDFFLEICLELRNFPLMPSTSPLQHLLKNVRAQRGPAAQKDLRGLAKMDRKIRAQGNRSKVRMEQFIGHGCLEKIATQMHAEAMLTISRVWHPEVDGGQALSRFPAMAFTMAFPRIATAVFRRGYAAEPVLSQLSRVVSAQGTGALEQLHASHPDAAEQRRDLLRRLGAEAEKDDSKKAEAIREALDALEDEHSLVRLAGIHALARVASMGSWQTVAAMATDPDELVRVAAVRAMGRMAEPGDAEALEFLEKAEKEAKDRSVRGAARDAAARLRGHFGALPGGGQATMLE
ncbi:unnamed protein product [Cladocopium goreaui]|uniref:HEAT repeat domain-containing protein n=1 Tax=Cladocopium goreaui TaxID=2562237 RepID=A0A9P1CZH8_9DINO|nr:unnamed protein product [Cladocopium goreaui]